MDLKDREIPEVTDELYNVSFLSVNAGNERVYFQILLLCSNLNASF